VFEFEFEYDYEYDIEYLYLLRALISDFICHCPDDNIRGHLAKDTKSQAIKASFCCLIALPSPTVSRGIFYCRFIIATCQLLVGQISIIAQQLSK